jgi:hypothetical protein
MTTNVRRLSFYNTAAAAEHYLGIRWPRAVWEEVLKQAIVDVTEEPTAEEWAHMPHPLDIRDAAQSWIDDDLNEPRRFAWVCEQLDLNPAAVRAAINRKKGNT